MKKSFLFLSLFSYFTTFAQEPQHICGNSAEDQFLFVPRLLENLAAIDANQVPDRGGVVYVPVHFHLVADSDGTGRGSELRAIEQLCALNAAYSTIGIQFYLSPHPTYGLFDKSINSSAVYTTQTNTFLMEARRHPHAINYFVTDVASSGNTGPGLTLAYYHSGHDWIVSRRDRINGSLSNNTIPHETGHFFSLAHPFLGWESSAGFDASYPGWPIAPVLAPDGGSTERQNGTNCTTAGDHICDTGPDYKFGFVQAGCSAYNGGAKDPIGTLVDPMENNMMSYFDGCTTYEFTPLQKAAMLADVNNAARNYLDNTYVPEALSIETPTDLLVAPQNAALQPYYNSIQLEWNSAPGATHYLIEVDVVPTFASVNSKTIITTEHTQLLTDLLPSKTYYWRVKPFNFYVGCAVPRSRSFKTSNVATTAVVEIEGLSAWQVSPNPVAGGEAHLDLNATQAFDATVSIVDAAGRTIHTQHQSFAEGSNVLNLSVEGLQNGFYFIVLENGKGRDVRKLAVAH